jgi:hypothetical protein
MAMSPNTLDTSQTTARERSCSVAVADLSAVNKQETRIAAPVVGVRQHSYLYAHRDELTDGNDSKERDDARENLR